MDIIRSGRPRISRLEIVEKGRRHEITRFQLNSRRTAVREERLGGGSLAGFVPVVADYDAAVSCGRKFWLFAGSDRGADRAAIMLTLIMTARLNDMDP